MDSPSENTSLLAEQLKLGNSKAYDFLMDSMYKKLCAYAYSLTKCHGNAEDIVQSVFVKVWINRKNINPDFSITNYMYKAVYNGFINQYRKNKPVVYLEEKYFEAIEEVIQKDLENLGELMTVVNKEIDKLPSKCKQIFLMNKKEGLTHIEISEHLDISIKTVEGHMTRAFKILSERIGTKIKPILFIIFDFRNQLNLQIHSTVY